MKPPDVRSTVLVNLVRMRVTAAGDALPASITVRPSDDADHDVDVLVTPCDDAVAAAVRALVPEARIRVRDGGGSWRRTGTPPGS